MGVRDSGGAARPQIDKHTLLPQILRLGLTGHPPAPSLTQVHWAPGQSTGEAVTSVRKAGRAPGLHAERATFAFLQELKRQWGTGLGSSSGLQMALHIRRDSDALRAKTYFFW